MKSKCLCCGYKTLPKAVCECVGFICPVCFWENDVFMNNMYDLKEKSDCNRSMNLEKARDNFKKYGACSKEFLLNVRQPNNDEM